MNLKETRRNLDRKLLDLEHTRRSIATEETALAGTQYRERIALEGQRIIQTVAETAQNSAAVRIASVVSRCLKSVFGEDAYEFRIKFTPKRGKTEADLLFVRNGNEIKPVGASGGGCLDISSFALRLATLMLSLPKRRKLLLIDEGFRFLSESYLPAARDLLLTLSTEMGIQMLVITHREGLMCGKVIQIGE